VFVTRFSWFGESAGLGGLPIAAFEAAVLIRAFVLVWCIVEWGRRPHHDLLPQPAVTDPIPT
jgi:hypothetical protein